MRKNNLMLLCAVLFATALPFMAAAGKNAASRSAHEIAADADIRSFHWGDSRKQVLKGEKAEVLQSENGEPVLYKESFLGLDLVFGYSFVNDELVGAAYTFKTMRADGNDAIADFEKVSGWLSEKYGKPEAETREWDNEDSKQRFAKDRSKWGEALSFDHMRQSAEWITPETYISHSLSSVNKSIVHVIAFSSLHRLDAKPGPSSEEKPKAKKKSGKPKPEAAKPEEEKKDQKKPEAPASKTP